MTTRSTFKSDFSEEMTPLDDMVYFMEQQCDPSEITRTAAIVVGMADELTGGNKSQWTREVLDVAIQNYHIAIFEAVRNSDYTVRDRDRTKDMVNGVLPEGIAAEDVISFMAGNDGIRTIGNIDEVMDFYRLVAWEDAEYSNPDTALDVRGGFSQFVQSLQAQKELRGAEVVGEEIKQCINKYAADPKTDVLRQWIESDEALKSALMDLGAFAEGGREEKANLFSANVEAQTSLETKAVPERSMEDFLAIVEEVPKPDREFNL